VAFSIALYTSRGRAYRHFTGGNAICGSPPGRRAEVDSSRAAKVEGPHRGPRPSPSRGHGIGMTVAPAPSGVPVATPGGDRREVAPSRSDVAVATASDRATRRSGIAQADGRSQDRPRRGPRRPPSGWSDRARSRPGLPRGGTDRQGSADARARTRTTIGPTGRDLRVRTGVMDAHSRGAHPHATPRWARKGARGVRVSRGGAFPSPRLRRGSTT